MGNYAGIWMDSRLAIILKIKDNVESEVRINAELDSKHVKGGSGSSTPYGAQDAVSDTKVLERRKHQISRYNKKILNEIKDTREVLLIGPGEAKKKLQQDLKVDHHFKGSVLVTETLDKLTDNQIRARIRDFFK